MAELIAITCASGKQATQIIPQIYKDYKLRLIVHSQQSLERLQKQYPLAEVFKANLNNPDDCAKILDGTSVMYHIGPTMHIHEEQHGINIIDAAITEYRKPQSKFAHFVFSSVLHPQLRKLLNHNRKTNVEEYLCESFRPYTILQPSHFADNTISRLLATKESVNPVFIAAHDPEVYFSFTIIRDHSDASVKVIQERSKHFYATYQIVSTRPMKYADYVKEVADEIGKSIEIKVLPYEQVVSWYCNMIFGEEKVEQSLKDGPERVILYYNGRGLTGNPNVLQWLIGRPATTPAQLARMLLHSSKDK